MQYGRVSSIVVWLPCLAVNLKGSGGDALHSQVVFVSKI